MEPRRPSNQAVDTRTADPRLKRAKPQPGRIQTLAARAACGILVALASLLTLPQHVAAQTLVDADWSLIPADIGLGEKFRLLFLSSDKTPANVSTINTYNRIIKDWAEAGHPDIRAYSEGFRAVGCTANVDAVANTGTTGAGVPIYWLNGNKAADNYADFYDGDWDEEAANKNESGENGLNTNNSGNYPATGCDHDGTKSFVHTISLALGASSWTTGRPNSADTNHGPLSGGSSTMGSRPMYGLSDVFTVKSGGPSAPAAPSVTATAGTETSLDVGWVEPANTGPWVTYNLRHSRTSSGPWINGPQNVTVTFANIENLLTGTAYWVQVLAGNADGKSRWSLSGTATTTSGAPGAPTNLTATANGQNRIDLNWTAPSSEGGTIPSNPGEPDNEMEDDRIRSYKIEVRSAASNWLVLDRTIGSTDTVYSHRDVPAGVLRRYRVSATNTAGTGLPSNEAHATTDSAEGEGAGTPTPDPEMQQSQTPLAASFVSVPATHDGETPFWLELSFDAPLAQGSKTALRELLDVTGGSETRFRRKNGQLDHWEIRIEPSSQNAVTVMLSPSPPCGETSAVCTEDGRTFTTGLGTQIRGPASENNNLTEEAGETGITTVPALPLAGIGILGLLLTLLGARRRVNDRRQLDASSEG